MLKLCAADPKYKEQMLAIGLDKKKSTNQEIITAAMVLRAAEGSERAYELIRDTLGEKPVDKVELNTIEINITDDET